MEESVRYELVPVEVFDMRGMTSLAGEVSRYYETIRARNIDSCVALFAEDAVSYDPVGMPPHHGRTGIREFLESLFSVTETFALTETSVLAVGNAAAVCWIAQAAGKNGRRVSFEGIDVITVDGDGKISSLYAFWDAPPVFAVLTSEASSAIKPPFTLESAKAKVQAAQDAWNTRDPERVAMAYTEDSDWRNRDEFLRGRDAIKTFLRRKWAKELDYRLRKELWCWTENRIAVTFKYEWHDESGQWYRSYGNELWEFDESGLMSPRIASINDVPIANDDRQVL